MKLQRTAGAAREKGMLLDLSHLMIELEQLCIDRLRMEADLKFSCLEADKLRREGLMKDKELIELTSALDMEKSLCRYQRSP